jgi:hypothetical protein
MSLERSRTVRESPAGVCRPSVKLEWVCPPEDSNIPQLGGVPLWRRGHFRGEVSMNSTISLVIAVLVIILLVILILQFV